MKKSALAILAVLLVGCELANVLFSPASCVVDERLFGTWQADEREERQAWLPNNHQVSGGHDSVLVEWRLKNTIHRRQRSTRVRVDTPVLIRTDIIDSRVF